MRRVLGEAPEWPDIGPVSRSEPGIVHAFAKTIWPFGSLYQAGTKLAAKSLKCDKSPGSAGFGFVAKRSASGRAKLE
jgi:hypothetical protein